MPTKRLMRLSRKGGSVETSATSVNEIAQRPSGISSTHFLKLVEERGTVGFWSLDFETNQTTASAGLYRLLGMDQSVPFVDCDLMRMMHPDDRAAHHDMHEVIQSGQAINREFRVIRPDGTLRWIQNKVEVVVDGEARAVRAVGLLIDVTEQHEARVSVEEAWQSYKTLLSAIAPLKWRYLPNGEVISRQRKPHSSGQAQGKVLDSDCLAAVHPDERDGIHSLWKQSLASGSPYAIDLRIRCADGAYRWFLARGAPLRNHDGSIREWIGLLIRTKGYEGHSADSAATILEAAHIRAARALLNWTMEDLALKADVSVSTIRRMESSVGPSVRNNCARAVRKALENGGISFSTGTSGEILISSPKAL